MSAAERCPATVWAGDRRVPCGKPVKRDGRCGVHANAQDRRQATDARYAEARERREAAKRIAAALIEATAIPFEHTFSGEITLTVAAAENLLRTYFGHQP